MWSRRPIWIARMSAGKQGQAERLKAALRENLKRRKAQARGRDEPPASQGEATSSDGPGREAHLDPERSE
jgi:hypothetical protein